MKRTARTFASDEVRAATLAVLALVVIAAIGAQVVMRLLASNYATERRILEAQMLVTLVMKFQLDEETAMRGYEITRRSVFLVPYDSASSQMPGAVSRLDRLLTALGEEHARALVGSIATTNEQWMRLVAVPVLTGRNDTSLDLVAIRGKTLVDRERSASKQVADTLTRRIAVAEEDTSRGFLQALGACIVAIVVAGSAILWYGIQRARLRSKLAQEQATVENLQRAFASRLDRLPNVQLGATYVSATEGARIGGDLFDVHAPTSGRGFLLVADVSGKGLGAAVDTALVKYTVRTLASQLDDPGRILTEMNRLLYGSLSNPDGFVSVFLAIVDASGRRIEYASAGHSAAFVRRRDGRVEQLAVTGPVAGPFAGCTFDRKHLELAQDDVLLVATDGLTEARGNDGAMLDDAGAMRWIARAPSADAQRMVDALVAKVRTLSGGVIRDDLAIVALRASAAGVAVVDEPERPATDAIASPAALV